jgi:hypothetical protein
VDADSITLHHPLLGTITVPWGEVDFIEPRFFGRAKVLSPDVRHLGNQVQPGFPHEQPLGTAWDGEFLLKNAPAGSAFLRFRAAELEPAGRMTPPGSRYLSELRSGLLGTEVFLNGQSLGRLNDGISRRTPVDSPQSIRLPIPRHLLASGQNWWRIEQTSLGKTHKEFDDCEIGPIVLELEETPTE